MNFSKKVNYTLLAFLVLLNIIIRYPTTSHKMGVDSFFIHGLANSISANGYAKWAVNPLSLFGLYPYSYPTAVPYLLSGVSQCMGLNMEWTIFLVAIFIGIFGMFSAYLMAMEVKNDSLFAFLVAFVFSTSPIFLHLTIWTTSARPLLIALLPLLIWSLLKYYHKKDKKYMFFSIVFLIILATVHRTAWLIIPIFLAYFTAMSIQRIKGKLQISKKMLTSLLATLLLITLIFCIIILTSNILPLILLPFVAYFLNSFLQKIDKKIRTPVIISAVLALLFVCAFIVQFLQIEFYKGIWYNYQTGYFFKGTDLHILLLNMICNYGGHTGILIVFGVVGIVILLFKPEKKFNDWFILLSMLFLTPLVALGVYLSLFLLPFFSILISIGLRKVITISWVKKYAFPAIIGCLLISLSFSGFMINHWRSSEIGSTNETWLMKDETYSASLFLKEYGYGAFISDDGIIGFRISASSSGVPLFSGSYAWPFAYGFTEEADIIGFLPIIPTSFDYIYEINDTVGRDLYRLLGVDCDNTTAKEILSKYTICYYVENNHVHSQDIFFKSVREKRYKIYDDGVESIWYLGCGIT